MKKIIFSILFLGIYIQGIAQYPAILNNYIVKPFLVNPARAGSDSVATIYMNYQRRYNAALASPTNIWASMDIRLKDDRHAIGINVMNDKVGYFQQTGVSAAYAFSLLLEKKRKSSLTFGNAIGFLNRHIDTKGILMKEEGDLTYLNSNFNQTFAIGSFGVHYNNRLWDVDFAIPNFIFNQVGQDKECPMWLSMRKVFVLKAKSKKVNAPEIDENGTLINPNPNINYVTGARDRIFALEPIISGYLVNHKFRQRSESYATGYVEACVMAHYTQLLSAGMGYRYFIAEKSYPNPMAVSGMHFFTKFMVPNIDCSIYANMGLGSRKGITSPVFELGLNLPFHKKENDDLQKIRDNHEALTIMGEKILKNQQAQKARIDSLIRVFATSENVTAGEFKKMKDEIAELDTFNWQRQVLSLLDTNIFASMPNKLIRSRIVTYSGKNHALLISLPKTVGNELYNGYAKPELSGNAIEFIDKAAAAFAKTDKQVKVLIIPYIYGDDDNYKKTENAGKLAKERFEYRLLQLLPSADKARISYKAGQANYPQINSNSAQDNDRISIILYFE